MPGCQLMEVGVVLHPFEIYDDYMNWDVTTKLSRQKSLLVEEEDLLSHLMRVHRNLEKLSQQRVDDVFACAKQLISLVNQAFVLVAHRQLTLLTSPNKHSTSFSAYAYVPS